MVYLAGKLSTYIIERFRVADIANGYLRMALKNLGNYRPLMMR